MDCFGLLKYIEEMITVIETDRFTINQTYVAITGLMKNIRLYRLTTTAIEIKDIVLDDLETRWIQKQFKERLIYFIATYLNPKYIHIIKTLRDVYPFRNPYQHVLLWLDEQYRVILIPRREENVYQEPSSLFD